MNVLGLDLGQTVGWFLAPPVGPARWGHFELESTTDLGRWLRSADAALQALLPMADEIAIEQPFLGASYYPARKLIALLGHCYWHAGFCGISASSIVEIPVATGKHTLAGHGQADKAMMIAAAAVDGYEGLSEHSADAYGIWKVHVFGKRQPIAKARAKNGKGVSLIQPPIGLASPPPMPSNDEPWKEIPF